MVALTRWKYPLIVYLFLFCWLSPKSSFAQVPDKASPFTAVEWEGDQPKVRFDGDWYTFHAIDGLSVPSIIGYCKKEYESRWQKRFSEDFVEVLTGMGVAVKSSVQLELGKDGQRMARTGTMSEDFRDMVRDYNNGEDALATESERSPRMIEKTTSNETSEERLARQMATWMDAIWNIIPTEEVANLRFLFTKGGRVFKGKVDIGGDFVFRARNVQTHVQAFNPNSNGRWVFEDLPPGTYNLSIEGQNEFEGWTWSKQGVLVTAKTAPLFDISLP